MIVSISMTKFTKNITPWPIVLTFHTFSYSKGTHSFQGRPMSYEYDMRFFFQVNAHARGNSDKAYWNVCATHALFCYLIAAPVICLEMSNPTTTCAQYVKHWHWRCVLIRTRPRIVWDRMANTSLDAHTFIDQNLPKY